MTPWLHRTFTDAPLYRFCTLGNTRLEFVHDAVPAGTTLDACDEPRLGEACAFARAFCEMRDVAGTASEKGIWLEVEVMFAEGRKAAS